MALSFVAFALPASLALPSLVLPFWLRYSDEADEEDDEDEDDDEDDDDDEEDNDLVVCEHKSDVLPTPLLLQLLATLPMLPAHELPARGDTGSPASPTPPDPLLFFSDPPLAAPLSLVPHRDNGTNNADVEAVVELAVEDADDADDDIDEADSDPVALLCCFALFVVLAVTTTGSSVGGGVLSLADKKTD